MPLLSSSAVMVFEFRDYSQVPTHGNVERPGRRNEDRGESAPCPKPGESWRNDRRSTIPRGSRRGDDPTRERRAYLYPGGSIGEPAPPRKPDRGVRVGTYGWASGACATASC